MRQRDHTREVDGHLLVEVLQIELAPIVNLKRELNPCVEENAVHVWVRLDDSGLSAGPYGPHGCTAYLLRCKLWNIV
jgi:hypothetical protein